MSTSLDLQGSWHKEKVKQRGEKNQEHKSCWVHHDLGDSKYHNQNNGFMYINATEKMILP